MIKRTYISESENPENKKIKIETDILIDRSFKNESNSGSKIFRVVIVADIVDRFTSIINPRGMETDPSLVTVGFNHNKCNGVPVNTGATLTRVYVEENYTYIGVDGKEMTIKEALIGEIEVPPTAKKNYCYPERSSNQKSAGSLLEAIDNKEIKSVSIGAFPTKESFIIRDGKECKYIESWDLRELSFLNVTSGQQNSSIEEIIRNMSDINQKNKAMSESDLDILDVVLSPENRLAHASKNDDGSYTVRMLNEENSLNIKADETEGWKQATLTDILRHSEKLAIDRACCAECAGVTKITKKQDGKETRSESEEANTEKTEEKVENTPETPEVTEPEKTPEASEKEEERSATPATEGEKKEDVFKSEFRSSMGEMTKLVTSMSKTVEDAVSRIADLSSEVERLKNSKPEAPKVDPKEMERSIIKNLKNKAIEMPTGVPVEQGNVATVATKNNSNINSRIFGRR